MPATFQKTIDKTLEGICSKIAFLDDILVITRGSLNEHEHEVDKILEKLDKENLARDLQKCEFVKNAIECLGFKTTPQRTTPLITKTEAIRKLEHPKSLNTITIIYGEHISPHKIYPESGRNNAAIMTVIEKTRQQKQQPKLE